ncbi:uncharacterized protein YkwD [Pseudaminobacter salicylatoxidans]|uniref:Uncharacterized protein YkwD n=1 Tax=Pseudaminobacter salicylatoxidans TaxID=93369 RepID=A0A316BVW8_PSESE|nr:CAP domain-containing protein [Pseudaminobacter salicylatoxidans]PWJ78408.1 uncharacterized protein YkwD [Pseudaminobacter salicylatoxidans]
MKSALKMAALCAVLLLAACQTAKMPGDGASVSADSYLAEIRTTHGLSRMVADPKLEKAALQQATYMARAGLMNHTTGWRKDFATRMKGNEVEGAAAENIAHGRMDMGKLFTMWMNSPGHRRNMLDPRFGKYGLAYVRDGTGSEVKYWALVLGR